MTKICAAMPVLIEVEGSRSRQEINITTPVLVQDIGYVCRIEFGGANRYDSEFSASDAISALNLAIVYMNGIVENSKDPEFFWTNGDTMFVDHDIK
ncbi:MAG: hypothetical protein ABJ239_06430 [Erythrobacter sp.]